MYKKIVIGIDQSYTRTGISIAADNKLLKVKSINFKGCKNKTEKRNALKKLLQQIIPSCKDKADEIQIISERIRTFSGGEEKRQGKEKAGFMNIGFIKATGALVATIVDTAYEFDVKVYSVDTRSWKAQVLGSSKTVNGDKKLATINFVKKLGFDLSYKSPKGLDRFDDDAADSACIALYGFVKKQTLNLED